MLSAEDDVWILETLWVRLLNTFQTRRHDHKRCPSWVGDIWKVERCFSLAEAEDMPQIVWVFGMQKRSV